MAKPRIGFLTIGQSPRVDVIPELLEALGLEVEPVEAGALDDMSYEEVVEKLAPEEGDIVYVSRMRDGRQVRMSKRKLLPLLQERIRMLNKAGVDLIAILCSGEFPRFESDKPVIYLDRVLKAFTEPLSAIARRVGILIPLKEQTGYAMEKWSSIFQEVYVKPISPYTASLEEFRRVAERLKEKRVEAVVMDCIGYRLEQRRLVKEILRVPVVSTRTSLANYLRELLT